MFYLFLAILVATYTLVVAIPLPQNPIPGQPGQLPANNLPLSTLMNAIPRSGIVGMADNIGAAFANFGNGQGSAFDAILSGIFNAFGNFISGVLGSGVINTDFMNYNNRQPGGAGAMTPPPPGGAVPGAGGGDEEPAEDEE